VGNIPRLSELNQQLAELSPTEKAQAKFDLVITSVLLDAGAGANWCYREAETGEVWQRLEGLAVASFRMFCQGAFSSNPDYPLQADAGGLQALTTTTLAEGFQVSPVNPLVGLEGGVKLLQRLVEAIAQHPHMFGTLNPRPGKLANYLFGKRDRNFSLSATEVLKAVLEGLGEIWLGQVTLAGVNLGDVWWHPALPGEHFCNQYVPFHKLFQWLTYSLLESLEELGLTLTGLEELTGLPEYRNSGLCLDSGLLQLKQPSILQTHHLPGSEVIVEWRALTVSLLDQIAATIRQKLDLSAAQLPLVKVLQGGTWSAGRHLAAQLREDGFPLLQIESDGTVF